MEFFIGGFSSDSDSAAWSLLSEDSLNFELLSTSSDGVIAVRFNDLDSAYGAWSVASSDNLDDGVVFWMELVDVVPAEDEEAEEEMPLGADALDDVPLDIMVQMDFRGLVERNEFYDFWQARGFFQAPPNAVPYYDYPNDNEDANDGYEADSEPEYSSDEEELTGSDLDAVFN